MKVYVDKNNVYALHKTIYNQNQQIAELKKQLEEKNQHIIELKKQLEEWVGDGTGYDGQYYNECIGLDQINEALNTILKEYQK